MINHCLSRLLDELHAGGLADPLGHRLDLATLRDALDRLAEGRERGSCATRSARHCWPRCVRRRCPTRCTSR